MSGGRGQAAGIMAGSTPILGLKKCQKFNENLTFLSFLIPIQTLTISEWFPIAYWAFPIAYRAFPIAIGRSRFLLGVLGYGLGVPVYLLMLDA